jgi:Xaa-Pro aminopeptidase
MHLQVMKMAKTGVTEQHIVGEIFKILVENNCTMSFIPICSVHSEILHNESYNNALKPQDLLLVDAGAESSRNYTTDITRTVPVNGTFTNSQKEIYSIVLNAQIKVIEAIKPHMQYKDVHRIACITITNGLKDLGLLKGNTDDIMEKGAHALFFPHGIGHAMGLDVHDMEGFGEDYVGYDEKTKRSNQFGLGYLRFGKEIKENYVLTVEPGVYFIPALIEKWKKEKIHKEFINYNNLKHWINFGGIRIEDDITVTDKGCRILGNPIPKTIDEIENYMNS